MAPSFFNKINTLINANLHGIVDRALETNSVRVMDEYIRQAERNLESLEDSAATVGGTVKTLKRKYDELAASAEALDRDIDSLIISGKNDLATAAQAKLNAQQELAADYYEQWQEQGQAVSHDAGHAPEAGGAPDDHPPGTRTPDRAHRADRGAQGGDQNN